jgi:hypothetical protein
MGVHNFPDRRAQMVGSKESSVDGSGGGGDDDGMEARIEALETANKELRESFETANKETRDRLIKIETRLDFVATKDDLHREISAQTWKLVTFVCGFGTALVAATYFLATHAK